MSLIIHRCTTCQHPDIWHGAHHEHICCFGHCRYGRHDAIPGPSERLGTYTPDGRAVTRLEPPGTRFAGFGRGTVNLCGCSQCWTLYARLAGDAA